MRHLRILGILGIPIMMIRCLTYGYVNPHSQPTDTVTVYFYDTRPKSDLHTTALGTMVFAAPNSVEKLNNAFSKGPSGADKVSRLLFDADFGSFMSNFNKSDYVSVYDYNWTYFFVKPGMRKIGLCWVRTISIDNGRVRERYYRREITINPIHSENFYKITYPKNDEILVTEMTPKDGKDDINRLQLIHTINREWIGKEQ